MSLPKRVVLVGPMGAGKSTIGRMLAKELGYRFLDSDRIIEERCGANIPWIFDVKGRTAFVSGRLPCWMSLPANRVPFWPPVVAL